MKSETAKRIEQRVKNITADIKEFIEKKLELFLITAGENYAEVTAEYIHKGAGLFMLALAFIFLLVALAEYIGGLLESQPLGYVIVSVPLIILGYFLFALTPKSLTGKVRNKLEEDVVRLLDKYEMKTDQSLSAIQIEENIKERENDGSK